MYVGTQHTQNKYVLHVYQALKGLSLWQQKEKAKAKNHSNSDTINDKEELLKQNGWRWIHTWPVDTYFSELYFFFFLD